MKVEKDIRSSNTTTMTDFHTCVCDATVYVSKDEEDDEKYWLAFFEESGTKSYFLRIHLHEGLLRALVEQALQELGSDDMSRP